MSVAGMLAVMVAVVAALFSGTPLAVAGTGALALGLAAWVLGAVAPRRAPRSQRALHHGAVVVAALGSAALLIQLGLEVAYPALGVLGLALYAAARGLRARVSVSAASVFAGAGLAVALVGLTLALPIPEDMGRWVWWALPLVAGCAVALHLWRRAPPRSATAAPPRPRGLTLATAGVSAWLLLLVAASGLAGPGRAAAALETRLLGLAPVRLDGSGWVYFSEAGIPRFARSRVLVVPARRAADGRCLNGGAVRSPRLGPGAAPFAVREIAFNARTCQRALRAGSLRR